MKSYVVLAGLLLIAVTGISSSPHPPHGGPMSEEMKKNLEECRAENGLSEEEERELFKKHDFNNPKMRCMPACLLKKEGLLEGNEINVDKFIEKMKERHPEQAEDHSATIEECVQKAKEKDDECELAQSFFHCIHEKIGHGHKGPHGPKEE